MSFTDLEARLVIFSLLGGFVAVGLWETFRPRRPLTRQTLPRWRASALLWLFNSVLLRALVPVSSVIAALWAAERGWGLFNRIETAGWLRLALSVLVLDLSNYALHRSMHAVPALWRVHWVHHSDPEYDLTTGLRFHPIEALATALVSAGLAVALGLSPWTALVIEGIGIFDAFVSHGNVGLAPGLDRRLRALFVTPDMHRVHHSTEPDEGNSNFGSIFSFWDRLFGTYIAEPRRGHEGMEIGTADADSSTPFRFLRLLAAPFRRRRVANRAELLPAPAHDDEPSAAEQ
jgi:sterol desaturase/sphingolipid hydroxylase (fatty acid hydroxylase superfamily)